MWSARTATRGADRVVAAHDRSGHHADSGTEQGRCDAGRRHGCSHILRSSGVKHGEPLFNSHGGKPRPRRAANLTGGRPIWFIATRFTWPYFNCGKTASSVPEDRLADFCLATIQGAMLMGKVKRSSQLVESIVHEAMVHLRRYARIPTERS